MATIVLDTFPLSSVTKHPDAARACVSGLDRCQAWVFGAVRAGHRMLVPAIAYYEVLRELERLGAAAQIRRLRDFTRCVPGRYLPLTNGELEVAAGPWAVARNSGWPTADPAALDCDVILAAQTLTVREGSPDAVVATTNPGHLTRYVNAELWSEITL
ncbi:MAG: hypothetical protein NT029_09275 [Armatimonadetes bacterium]|nr:hypothetical protein [Armatimonadota bacterium]